MAPPSEKNAIGILKPNHLVKLEQVDGIRPEAAQRFVDLLAGLAFAPAVDLGHQEGLVAVAILQRLAHAHLALTIVVIPAIIQEVIPRSIALRVMRVLSAAVFTIPM
jgi:hypothetical protein